MSKKSSKHQPQPKGITREHLIIVALVSFIIGYAVNGLVNSYKDFGNSAPVSGQQVSSQNPPQTQAAAETPQPVNDGPLLEKVEANPQDLDSWISLGNMYFDSGNYEKAINAYSKALDIDPNNANVITDLGIMYRRTGDLPKAIQSFKKAQEIDPSHQMSQYNMGIVFFYDMQNVEGAVGAWNQLLRQNPDFVMPNGQRLFDFVKTLN